MSSTTSATAPKRCQECVRRHKQCSKSLPDCSQCIARQAVCVYDGGATTGNQHVEANPTVTTNVPDNRSDYSELKVDDSGPSWEDGGEYRGQDWNLGWPKSPSHEESESSGVHDRRSVITLFVKAKPAPSIDDQGKPVDSDRTFITTVIKPAKEKKLKQKQPEPEPEPEPRPTFQAPVNFEQKSFEDAFNEFCGVYGPPDDYLVASGQTFWIHTPLLRMRSEAFGKTLREGAIKSGSRRSLDKTIATFSAETMKNVLSEIYSCPIDFVEALQAGILTDLRSQLGQAIDTRHLAVIFEIDNLVLTIEGAVASVMVSNNIMHQDLVSLGFSEAASGLLCSMVEDSGWGPQVVGRSGKQVWAAL